MPLLLREGAWAWARLGLRLVVCLTCLVDHVISLACRMHMPQQVLLGGRRVGEDLDLEGLRVGIVGVRELVAVSRSTLWVKETGEGGGCLQEVDSSVGLGLGLGLGLGECLSLGEGCWLWRL
jgi:hypothetical protein